MLESFTLVYKAAKKAKVLPQFLVSSIIGLGSKLIFYWLVVACLSSILNRFLLPQEKTYLYIALGVYLINFISGRLFAGLKHKLYSNFQL